MKQGWESKKLGEVCDIFNGATPLRRQKEYWEDGVINWFTVEDIRQQGRIINHTNQKISQLGFDNTSIKLLPARSILLCCTASVGEYAITNIELTTNQQFNGLVVKDSEQLLPEYLFHFSSTLKSILLSVSGKTTIDFVSMTKLKNVEIPVPPLEEQKQIVAKLDQCFEAIDKAKANAAKNLENAKELFQSKLNEIFSQKGEDWVEKKLGDVCEIQPPKRESREKLNDQDLVSFVPMKNLGELRKELILNEERELLRVYSNYTYFSDNDVLLAKITPCFENGKIGIAKNLKNGIGFGSSEYVVYRPNKELESEFLFYYLYRNKFRIDGKRVMTGAVGHKRIPKEFIKDQLIPVPLLEVQRSVINLLNTLQEQTQSLESKYQQELNSLEELKKSILQKAFEGEL